MPTWRTVLAIAAAVVIAVWLVFVMVLVVHVTIAR